MLGRLPDKASFVVGPEKTATTFIQLLLEQHPQLCLPQGIKETFFFDKFHDNGLAWYLQRFDLSGPEPHLVEVAPSYFCEEEAIARLAAAFPRARIVICVRDVVARTISHYHHLRRYGYLNTSLAESLDPSRRPLRASLYSRYIPMWEKAFGAEQVHVLDMALLERDPARFAEQVFEAVGVRAIKVPQEVLAAHANERMEPRHFLLAHTATLVSNKFKQWGLYGVLAFLRKTPVHGLVFGSRKPVGAAKADAATRARLEALLSDERRFLAERYGIGRSDT